MNVFNKGVYFSALALALSACGGGGGGGGGSPSANPVGSGTVSSSSSSVANSIDYSAVTGLYDASITANNIKDESYLYISTEGQITAYNYMGDSKDLGGNCYRVAIASDTNAILTGKTLSYSSAEAKFAVNLGDNFVNWILDANKKLSKISYNGSITASSITLKSSGNSISVGSKTILTPTISDITSSLCK